MLPGTNAVLLEVAAAGPADRHGKPGAGTASWTGRAPGYLRRSDGIDVVQGVEARVRRTELVFLRSTRAPSAFSAGPDAAASTVLVEDRRVSPSRTRRWTVTEVQQRVHGLPIDHVVLRLDDERP